MGKKGAADEAEPASGEAPAVNHEPAVKAEPEIRIAGHIERVEAGHVVGWAAKLGDEEPLKLAVCAGETIIGRGVADRFRADLRQSGVGRGFHAFTIPIREFAGSGTHKLHLADAETGARLPLPDIEVTVRESRFAVTLESVRDNHIEGVIESAEPIGSVRIRLYHNDGGIGEVYVDSAERRVPFRIALPAALFDDNIHYFVAGVEGFPFAAGMNGFRLNTILTPWEYLKESVKEPTVAGLSRRSAHLYASLCAHLRAPRAEDGMSDANLMTVHDVVAEGYQGRTRFPRFALPKVDRPQVSIIVPVYNKFNLTYHCLASIALAYNETSYEVIVADDCSTDETAAISEIIDNVVVSRTEENLRFLRNCNQAARLARGDFLIFLNNDTEVTTGWIDELIAEHRRDPSVGLSGSKLLNEDGTLQEAGGIVWKTGEPWNVGRNANPMQPEYNYKREADYVSGAAMCIPKAVWEEVGHFSERYVPCYYEDTDLAFKVRAAGYKVVYVPTSVVTHFEGQSHGRDVTKGLKAYQVVNEKTFRSTWFRDFRNKSAPSMEAMGTEKDRNVDHRVLVIDYATPTPHTDAGSYAAVQEIRLMQSLGFKVTFVPENMAHMGRHTLELQRMGVEVLHAPFYTSVFDVIDRRLGEMDAVYLTRYEVAERYLDVVRQRSSAKILFNNADLHFLRELRGALKAGHQDLSGPVGTRDRELRVMREVDAVLSYNQTEHAVIMSHILRMDHIFKCPWVLDVKEGGLPFAERQGIAFLGGYRHTPNIEAVKFFAGEVMPLIEKELPGVKFYVYGSHVTDEIKALESESVKIVGFVDSLDDVFHHCRVFVAPLISGAGIKGKVLEAISYGVPCVLSDVAAEGTGLSNKISALIANKPAEWVAQVKALYTDEGLWTKLAENERILAREDYSFEKGRSTFNDMFTAVGLYTIGDS